MQTHHSLNMANLKACSNPPGLKNLHNKSHLSSSASTNCKNLCISCRKRTQNGSFSIRNGEQSWWGTRVVVCSAGKVGLESNKCEVGERGLGGFLLSEYGWRVRSLNEEEEEMRRVAQVQAEAFHVPIGFFDDFFFEIFKAEVLSGLLYKLRNSPPNRYACLVAEASDDSRDLVGVVDVTVLRDEDVLRHLEGVEEYLYVSGIAVLTSFRRQKVATVLLKACDLLSLLWGFDYLALRAYEDDSTARKLYSNAGYKIVSGDPPWISSWIGRKRRVLMVKRSPLRDWF